jgi:hypothetical protein
MPTSDLDVLRVVSKEDLDLFVEFPYAHYRGDPNFVPPLRYDVRLRLDAKRHPYFRFSEAALFLARRRGVVVGRIAATVNSRHNEYHAERTGFFGFFECVREFEPARALFDAAGAWLKSRGMDTMRGPASFSTNDECGLLVEGFDGPPVVMMPYNPPWYADLVEAAGFRPAMDLFAWKMSAETADLARWARVAARVAERDGLSVRSLDLRRFDRELRIIQDLYADAWSTNWGFVPMTDPEFDFMGRQLKPVVIPEYCVFLMKDGKEAGFALALPDLNRIIKDLDGRLLPFGWLKLLLRRRRIDFARILTLGVRRDFHGRGYDGILYHELTAALGRGGVFDGEMSWVLATNEAMNNAMRRAGGRVYRTYRLYDVAL